MKTIFTTKQFIVSFCLFSGLVVNVFALDTVKPVLTTVTAVPTRTNDSTPSYTFSTTEGGSIIYGGACSSATVTVGSPIPPATKINKTITFSALAAGTYSNCTIKVKDSAGNTSLLKAINKFTIDLTKPVLAQVTPVPNVTNDTTPTYTFSSTEGGTIIYTGACASATTTVTAPVAPATKVNKTITLNMLPAGNYSTCSIKVKDAAGNISVARLINTFKIDLTPPVLTQVTPVPIKTNDVTPNYTFSSTEGGTIIYAGACSSSVTSVAAPVSPATKVNKTITLNALAAGSYSTCSIKVKDAAGNISAAKLINAFTIDLTKPVLAQVTPVPSNTYDTTPNYTFSTTEGGTIIYTGPCSSATTSVNSPISPATKVNKTVTFNSLSAGTYSTCSIKVKDAAGNFSDAKIINTFTIDYSEPVIFQVGGIQGLSNNTAPMLSFHSTEAGTITYNGWCAGKSATQTVVAGYNAIIFSPVLEGSYSGCTLYLTDTAGNTSALFTVNAFTVDTTAPQLQLVTPVMSPTGDSTPDLTFSSTETGTIFPVGSCSFSSNNVVTGNNTKSLNTLASGTYTNCTLRVADQAGNFSAILSIPSFTVDTIKPVLAIVTGVPPFTNDTTPNFTFSSTKQGYVTYAGDCASVTGGAIVGNLTVTFNALSLGTHSNCTVKVTDYLGNISAVLNVGTFVVDQTPPIIAQISPIATPTKAATFSFSSNKAGTLSFSGDCSSANNTVIVGNNVTNLLPLSQGVHSNCGIRVNDLAGNESNFLELNTFVFDSIPPTLTIVTLVPTFTNDNTPNFNFSSSDAGTILYQGSCSSSTTLATVGVNLITFNELTEGLHNDCIITVLDAALNESAILVNSFTFEHLPPPGSNLYPNDTGITLCGDYAWDVGSLVHQNNLNCAAVGAGISIAGIDVDGDPVPAGQDGVHGRDANVAYNSSNDGVAGFSYTKIGVTGTTLAVQNGVYSDVGSEEDDGSKWSCILDNNTGLMWETKTNDSGLRDGDWTYSWYSTDAEYNAGVAGTVSGGTNCYSNGRCDTEKYIEDVNASNLCGASDWRLPSVEELQSIIANDRSLPAVDTSYFVNVSTTVTAHWTSTMGPYLTANAQRVNFNYGDTTSSPKFLNLAVRLVRQGSN